MGPQNNSNTCRSPTGTRGAIPGCRNREAACTTRSLDLACAEQGEGGCDRVDIPPLLPILRQPRDLGGHIETPVRGQTGQDHGLKIQLRGITPGRDVLHGLEGRSGAADRIRPHCSRSSGDRAPASGAGCAGSNPAGSAEILPGDFARDPTSLSGYSLNPPSAVPSVSGKQAPVARSCRSTMQLSPAARLLVSLLQ